jgi:hypothetical protein
LNQSDFSSSERTSKYGKAWGFVQALLSLRAATQATYRLIYRKVVNKFSGVTLLLLPIRQWPLGYLSRTTCRPVPPDPHCSIWLCYTASSCKNIVLNLRYQFGVQNIRMFQIHFFQINICLEYQCNERLGSVACRACTVIATSLEQVVIILLQG